jgi:Putative transposase
MKMLTRRGVLVEDMGQTYLTEPDAHGEEARTLRPLQAAAITDRIAFGHRAGQKVLTLRGAPPRDAAARQPLCADIDGFSLHAAVRVEAHERKRLEQLCLYITRPALSDERVQLNTAGQLELKLKTPWRDGTTHLVMSPQEFMQRLAGHCRVAAAAPAIPDRHARRVDRAAALRRPIYRALCPGRVGQRRSVARSHRRNADPQVERPDSRRPRSAVADPQPTSNSRIWLPQSRQPTCHCMNSISVIARCVAPSRQAVSRLSTT